MTTVIPMQSARLAVGQYEVIGTSTGCLVLRGPDCWGLYSNGELVGKFPTKLAALVYCQEHPEL